MSQFFPSSGCVYAPAGTGAGAYALSGLQSSVPILITGAQVMDTDLILPVVCLNGVRIVYAFGQNFGEAGVNGLALLGSGGANNAESLKSFVDGKRTSAGGTTAYLSTPLGGFKVYVTGLSLGSPDSDFQIQPFVITCKLES